MNPKSSGNGKPPGKSKTAVKEITSTASSDRANSWQLLSVQEFFSQCNWQGQRLEIPDRDRSEPTSLFTLPVGEFFRLLPWEGTPAVGFVPKAPAVPVTAEPDSTEVTLNELLDLF